jgi:beta-lactamase regulating signal transducer with metallopeptidase domain
MIAISILIKATIVVVAAGVLQRLLVRRASAAARHLVWTLALGAVLALPVLTAALPEWAAVTWSSSSVPAVTASVPRMESTPGWLTAGGSSFPAVVDRTPSAPQARAWPVSWPALLWAIYGAGVLLFLGRLAVERRSIARLSRRAGVMTDDSWVALVRECAAALGVRGRVRLLRDSSQTMPMAFGVLKPAILLPHGADEWSDDRRRAVVLHELAHVGRLDCLTQAMAAVACAVYWPHPGVWWMARRLRVERELACDDCVLTAGADARAYAGHLLEIAYAHGQGRTSALAVAMAGSRQLEGRLLALLDAARHRAAPALRSRLTAAVAALALIVPIAAATAKAIPSSGSRLAADPDQAARAQEAPEPLPDPGPGTWEIRTTEQPGIVQLSLSERLGHRNSNTVPMSALPGLTADALAGPGGPIKVAIRRDAGVFAFEGVARNGVAAGTYLFEPDPSFADQLVTRGLARPTLAQQQLFARQDIGPGFIDQVTRDGVRPTIDQLVRAAQHGVDPEFVRGLRDAGYKDLGLDELIALRNHGVDPDYIRELAVVGHKGLSLNELINLRNHGVDPDYIRQLGEQGHKALSLDALVRLRSHGVDPDYIRELAEVGHKGLSLDELVNLRNHGVDPDYVRELGELGHRGLSLDRLVALRGHGVDPDYVRELGALGHKGLSLDELITLRNHGVDPDYIREFAAAGYDKLSLETLVELRSHGVDADYAKEIQNGGPRPSLDDLIDYRSRGVTGDRLRSGRRR